MTTSDRNTLDIAEAFTRYLESKDVSLIEGFNREEIEFALLQLIREDDAPYYTAMKIRREELKEKEDTEKGAPLKYRIKTIVIVIALAILLVFLKLIYYP